MNLCDDIPTGDANFVSCVVNFYGRRLRRLDDCPGKILCESAGWCHAYAKNSFLEHGDSYFRFTGAQYESPCSEKEFFASVQKTEKLPDGVELSAGKAKVRI